MHEDNFDWEGGGMRFSERNGILKAKDVFQLNSMDNDLRNSLWNVSYLHIFQYLDKVNSLSYTGADEFAKLFWRDFLKKPIDTIPNYSDSL
jgi:hypothetical protein